MWREIFHSLGLVPAEKRSVKPMPAELRGLVSKPTDNVVTLKSTTPNVESDTMPAIISKVKRTLYQSKKLAAKLKGPTLTDTLRNDSNFILQYIKYKKDHPDHEQIRSPRRLVHDAQGDCDCFAVFLASVLSNQGIKFRFRITKYANGNDWSHIYIIVPKDHRNDSKELDDRSTYYVLDPVTNQHDYEVTFKQKRDYTMALQYLDGIGSGTLGACDTDSIVQKSLEKIGMLRQYLDNDSIRQKGLVPTEEFLINNNIPYELKVNKTTNGGYVEVVTKNGAIASPTIITKEDAQELYTAFNAPQQVQQEINTPQSEEAKNPVPSAQVAKAGVNWWGILLTAGGVLASMKPAGGSGGHMGKLPGRNVSMPAKKVVHI